MIKKHIKFFFFLTTLFLPGVVFAQYGLDQTAQGAGLTKYSGDISVIIGNLIGSALAIIGVIFFLLMVYGGFLWMTDRGKGEYMEKAKDAIIAAVIGLVLVLGAYAITNFVFSSVEDGASAAPSGGGGGADVSAEDRCRQTIAACFLACPANDPGCLAGCGDVDNCASGG